MVRNLWSFLRNSPPEAAMPFPWERCFDIRSQVLFYKNTLNGSTVMDLRSRVNLGGGMFHLSNMWVELTGRCCCFSSQNYPLLRESSQYDEDPSVFIRASCCGPLVYLLVPEIVHRCPICDCLVYYIA